MTHEFSKSPAHAAVTRSARFSRRQVLTAALATAAWPALAQSDAGTKPLRLLIPYSVGTPPEVLGRIIGERMQASTGQSVIVDAKPGASGQLAYAELMRLPADGQNLLVFPMALTVTPALYPDKGLQFGRDLQPISQVGWAYNVLVVHPDVPARTLTELVALIKVNPDKYAFGSGGNGTPSHLLAEMFKQQAGVKAMHTPYNQLPQAVTDLIGGRLQFMFLTLPAAMAQVSGGRLRALAVNSPQRLDMIKDIPTMTEAGYPQLQVADWQGVVARAGTPSATVERLHTEIRKAVALPEVQARMGSLGMVPHTGSSSDFGRLIAADVTRWAEVVKTAGIKVD